MQPPSSKPLSGGEFKGRVNVAILKSGGQNPDHCEVLVIAREPSVTGFDRVAANAASLFSGKWQLKTGWDVSPSVEPCRD